MRPCGMRAIWTGSVSFGLVNVPVKLYGATESHDLEFHQVHADDGGRIKYQRTCEVCGKTVPYQDIDRAYDDGERTVILEQEDFDELPAAMKDEIEVVQFVPSGQVDPVMLEKPYFLEPTGKSPKSYLLLRETLEQTDLTAVVRFSLRQKTRLGVLRVRDKVLVLQGLLWADEVRDVDFPAVKSRAKVTAQELKMAAALVEQYADDFDPSQFTDDYQEELRKLVDAKLEHGDAVDTAETFGDAAVAEKGDEGEGAEVIDLMEVLKRSLARKRGTKDGDSAGEAAEDAAETSTGEDAGGSASKSRAKSSSTSRTKSASASSKTDATSGSTKSAKSTAKSSAKSSSAKSSTSKSSASKASTAKSSTAKRGTSRSTESKRRA